MDDIWLKVKELAADGNGIVSTKQVERLGISRAVLKNMWRITVWSVSARGCTRSMGICPMNMWRCR